MEVTRESTVLYDADCGLCLGAVDFVRRRLRDRHLRFVPLTSVEAVFLLADGPPPGDTLILIDEGGRHDRSTAALRIAAALRRPWSWLRVLRVVPRPLRDRAYDFIARRRLRWRGSAIECRPGSRCLHPGRR